jgi:hypothetical protein
MSINSSGNQLQITDSTQTNVANVDILGNLQFTNDVDRRIQEIMMLMQQSQLLSIQLSNDKTGRYNLMEIR